MKKLILMLAALSLSFHGFSQTIVADYNFNGITGTTVPDQSGNSLYGTIHGGVTSTAGQSGVANTAVKFNGSTGYIAVPASSLLNLTSWTIMTYVKFDGFYNGTCQVNCLVVHGLEDGANFYRLDVDDNTYDNTCSPPTHTDHETPLGAAAGVPPIPPAPTYFIDTNWHCITGTYGNDTLKVYVDGSLISKEYWANNYNYSSNDSLYIGSYYPINHSFPYWFNGKMDKLTIWDGALTDSAINAQCSNATVACSVNDISYSSSMYSSLTYTFTPNVTPSTATLYWNFGDGHTATGTATATQTHTFASAGSYHVCLSVVNDSDTCSSQCFYLCMNSTKRKESSNASNTNTNSTTSIKSAEATAVKISDVYPNPANTVLNIPVVAASDKIVVTVYSIDGVKMLSKTLPPQTGTYTIQLAIAQLKPGNYTVELFDGRGRTERIFTKI